MATTPNTGTSYYLDTPVVSSACKKNFEKIDKACAPESASSDKNKHPVLRKMLGAERVRKLDAMAEKIKGKYSFKDTSKNAWMSHCDGLWIKPGADSEELNNFNSLVAQMSEDLSGAIEKQIRPLLETVGQEIKDKAMAEAKEKAVKAGGRAAVRWGVGATGIAAGGVGGAVTEAVATAWNIVDWAGTGYQTIKVGIEAWRAIGEMKTVLELAQTAQSQLHELAGSMGNKTPFDVMAEGMAILARLNACTRARRCLLVPFRKTGAENSLTGDGCCPGQTGHHILPDEMTKDGNCHGYHRDNAPTICAEGANNANGTHGKIHRQLNSLFDRQRRAYILKKGAPKDGESSPISYPAARDLGILSISKTFPESKCDPNCLRAQLDSYYKEKCLDVLPAVSGVSGKSGKGRKKK